MTAPATAAIILAAGLGKRMHSELPKVLHPICGEALLDHVLRAVEQAGVGRIYCITGHKGELVQAHIGTRATCVDQPERLGTGHAVMQAAPLLADFDGDVIVTCGDAPLISTETFQKLIDLRRRNASAGVVLTAILPDAGSYGRIIRDERGDAVRKIVEAKDCTPAERAVREVNTGTYCFHGRKLFEALKQVTNNNAQGEYYLTDTVEILLAAGERFDAVATPDWTEMIGVNSRQDLAEAAHYLNARLVRQAMAGGVSVTDPAATYLEVGVRVGAGSTLEPGTILRGQTAVGTGCIIGPHTELIDATVGDGARVRHAVVEGAAVPAGATVGPFVHLK